VFQSKKRFKVVVAGRRGGKTNLAMSVIIEWAASTTMKKNDIFYVAPTFQQAKDIFWDEFVAVARDIIQETHINTGVITFINGVKLHLKGSDRPETLRGKGLRGLVIDEYADMKPFVWEEILRATLSDAIAPALFIGTPKGRNHFYQMAMKAKALHDDPDSDWGFWTFKTSDNPFISKEEIEKARTDMSSMKFAQEYEASFVAGGAGLFEPEWVITTGEKPRGWTPVVAVDLAGYVVKELNSGSQNKHLDSCSICPAFIQGENWVVPFMEYGRWTVAETAIRIISACKEIGALILGVEKGLSLQSLYNELLSAMQVLNWYVRIVPLTHGNTKKEDRVVNALQGRLEKGKIAFIPGDYLAEFTDQLVQFPAPGVHDDLPDSLSLVDQLAKFCYSVEEDQNYEPPAEPLDPISGY
jgi:hypothetical protein